MWIWYILGTYFLGQRLKSDAHCGSCNGVEPGLGGTGTAAGVGILVGLKIELLVRGVVNSNNSG